MSDTNFPFNQPTAWQPDDATISQTNLAAFWRKHGLKSYDSLVAWAIQDVGRFWGAVMEDLGVEFYQAYERVLDDSGGIERPRWCPGGEMNIIHNMLDKWIGTPVESSDAIRYVSEEGFNETITYADLSRRVEDAAAGLRASGIGHGDAVGLYMPLTPELVIAFLAVIKVGGIVLPLFSGYGSTAVATRLRDADAKALFVANALVRRGKPIDMKSVADEALTQCPTVTRTFVHQRVPGFETPFDSARDVLWTDLLEAGRNAPPDLSRTERTSAEDPLMIIYTSGTTGRPKGAVHTHCGFPIKAAQDMRQPMDLKPGEVMWWMTDMGWMMGPWLVFGTLLNGATMVLFDGAPDYPQADRIWEIAAGTGTTHLGISPTLIRSLKGHGNDIVRSHDLSTLRAVASTGSPWDPESWNWLFEEVLERKKPVINYSGGTEISGGIVCGNFVQPLKPCGFSGQVVGMDADVVDDAGQSVRGAVGELVIRKPWIGMTRGFWQDEQRYHDTYWARHPNLWTHGDFAAVDNDGQWFILGRSDDTIKVAGKRLGPAEVESILNADSRILESAAVGVPDDAKGEALVAFCVLSERGDVSEKLRGELSDAVVNALGKALKPKAILFVARLPKTRNGKVMRRLARAAYLGADLGDITSIEDPSTLEDIAAAH
ncbi:AMP-binding protein [soil metagenome]